MFSKLDWVNTFYFFPLSLGGSHPPLHLTLPKTHVMWLYQHVHMTEEKEQVILATRLRHWVKILLAQVKEEIEAQAFHSGHFLFLSFFLTQAHILPLLIIPAASEDITSMTTNQQPHYGSTGCSLQVDFPTGPWTFPFYYHVTPHCNTY